MYESYRSGTGDITIYDFSLGFVSGKNTIGAAGYNYTEKIKLEKNKYKLTYKVDNPSIATFTPADDIGLKYKILASQVGTTKLTITLQYNPTANESYTLVNQSFLLEVDRP
jgi:hypothetical protein